VKRERDIALEFTGIFGNYPLLTPSMNAERGWPDKLIQLPNSRVVACELKRVFVNQQDYYLLSELRQEQCAWLAKWQRNDGKCFVFCGVMRDEALLGYDIIIMPTWYDWIHANKQKYGVTKLLSEDREIINWFVGWCRA
jgi:hypothetical protein